MIDWLYVLHHALWIAGLALVLASWSYYHWLATVSGEPRAVTFRRRPWIVSSAAGLALFALGQALLLGRWYEHAGWSLVLVYALFDGVQRWRSSD